jgi:hypothetical protein
MKFQLQVSEQVVSCEELTVSLYKDLLKSIYGDEPDIQVFIQTVSNILSSLTDKPLSFFENLSVMDLMSCLLQLRMNSLGDRVIVSLNLDDAKRSLELRLDWVNEEILDFNKSNIKNTIKVGTIEVEIDSPSPIRLIEKISDEYLYFVKSIKIDDKILVIETNDEAKNITERLPIKVTFAIIEHFEKIIKEIKSLNFLKRYKITEHNLGFIPSNDSLLWFTKLIFNESLESFYDNIFYLAKLANIPPSYTESCSVGEYFVYTGTLQRTLAQQNSEQQDSSMLHNEATSDFPN